MKIKNLVRSLVAAAGLLVAQLWAPSVLAQQSACVSYEDDDDYGDDDDDDQTVCMQLSAQPDAVVQASRLGGGQDTFVRYTANLSLSGSKSYTKSVSVKFTLSPAVDIVQYERSPQGVCTVSGAQLSCAYEKLYKAVPSTITFTAKAPEYTGASTPSTLVNSGVFGWKYQKATVSKSLTVSTQGGYTWVPPNTDATLVTAPETADPANQTTPENPVFGKMFIPARPTGFLAYLALNNNANEDLRLSCPNGLYFMNNSDGGPYVCRDVGAPYDAGNPRRWVAAAIDDEVDGSFTDSPLQLSVIWDSSVVPPAQLAPSAAGPTGTPPLAVFYRAGAEGDPVRAFAQLCSANEPPCLSNVQRYSTGDWTATLQMSLLDNGGAEADPLLPPLALRMLDEFMNGLLEMAHAGIIPPPVIIK